MTAPDPAALYRDYGPLVLRRARQLLGNASEADDVLQEVFMRLVANPDQLDGPGPHAGWFYRATTHRCLNQMRNRRTRARLLAEAEVRSATADASAEALALLRQVLARLPRELAEVAVYYYVDCMTHDEIAAVTRCSRRQVGNLLTRFSARAEKLRRSA